MSPITLRSSLLASMNSTVRCRSILWSSNMNLSLKQSVQPGIPQASVTILASSSIQDLKPNLGATSGNFRYAKGTSTMTWLSICTHFSISGTEHAIVDTYLLLRFGSTEPIVLPVWYGQQIAILAASFQHFRSVRLGIWMESERIYWKIGNVFQAIIRHNRDSNIVKISCVSYFQTRQTKDWLGFASICALNN